MTADHGTRTGSPGKLPPPLRTAGFTEDDHGLTVASVDFKSLYIAERSRLHRYLRLSGASPHEADDAVQTAFAQAWVNRAKLTVNPRAWLYKAAYGAFLRGPVRVQQRETSAGDTMPERAEPLDSGEVAIFNEFAQEVQAAVANLPAKQNRIMSLTLVGFSPSEIAQQLDCDPAAVRQNLHRARRTLAQKLRVAQRRDS